MKQIVSTSRITGSMLSHAEQVRLAAQLYEIYAARSEGASPETFDERVFGEGRCVALFRGADGELAGFADVGVDYLEHEGRTHAIVTGGFFFRPGYRGGAAALRFALLEAIRLRLRAPFARHSVVTRASTPAAYRLFAAMARTIHPAPGKALPPGLESLLQAAIGRLGLVSVDGTCWLVRSQALPRSLERFESTAHEDAYERFFRERNPRFYQDRTALLMWLPLDLANVATGLFRASLAIWRRRRARGAL